MSDDPILQAILALGVKDTATARELYLATAFPQGPPEPWTPEMEAALPPEIQVPDEPPVPLAHRKAARTIDKFDQALAIIDKSEDAVRAIIERDLMNIAGVNRTKYGTAKRAADHVMKDITAVRRRAFKSAFRMLRDSFLEIDDRSWSLVASTLLQRDLARIDNAIRTGLIAGLDNIEIGRKVIGSMGLNGGDGVTEFTRKHITLLARQVLKRGKS